MKKILKLVLLGVIVSTSFTSCKKGANDPFLSFKSRKSRLTGEWSLSDGKITQTFSGSGGGGTYVTTYDGSTETITYTGNSSTKVYTQTWTFDKDGSWEESLNDDGNTSTTNGYWLFTCGSKAGDYKKKERIILSETKYTDKNGVDTYEGKTLVGASSYTLDKLSSKELILLIDNTTTSQNGNTTTTEGTITFTK